VTLLPCPFCGHVPQIRDPDVLYPINNSYEIWNIVCPASSGGCDTSILAGSSEEAIRKWNTRV